MRLAKRFRPMRWNKTIKANTKKSQKRINANYAVLKSLAEKK